MADDNAMAKRGKALEEEYFHRKEKELKEKLRQRRAAEAQMSELAEATGNPNEEVLKTLQELGYTRDTVALFHYVPLLHVAWADGKVSRQERELIVEAARTHGISEGSAADKQLSDWIDNRPSEEFFEQTLRIMGALLDTTPRADGTVGSQGMLDEAKRLAEASGGILGFGSKISPEEQALLDRIAAALGKSAE